MTTPEPGGSASPRRLAGLALLGVAAIALVIGLVVVISDDSGTPGAAPPSQTAPPPSSEVSDVPPPTGGPSIPVPPSSSVPPPPASSSAVPPPPSSAQPPPSSQPPPGGPDRTQPVRVYNNSTIKGLAERAAADFKTGGFNVVQVDNYPHGIIPQPTAYYRPGTPEEAVARQLAADYGLRVEPRFAGIQDSAPGVIVIVTKDYRGSKDK